jgi:hypothetical protein
MRKQRGFVSGRRFRHIIFSKLIDALMHVPHKPNMTLPLRSSLDGFLQSNLFLRIAAGAFFPAYKNPEFLSLGLSSLGFLHSLLPLALFARRLFGVR